MDQVIDKKYRCDKSMRKSKERCYTPYFKKWKCTEECLNCICCIVTSPTGDESHVRRKDEQKAER